jgi:hypothetical protein
MNDLFGHAEAVAPFKDIRNQRESVAEEKARLCQELNGLLRRTPKASAIATVQQVTAYKYAHKAALKVLQCKTSSRQELETAITSMTGWHGESA